MVGWLRERQTDRQAGRQAHGRWVDDETDRQAGRQADGRRMDDETDRQAGKKEMTERWTMGQTDF